MAKSIQKIEIEYNLDYSNFENYLEQLYRNSKLLKNNFIKTNIQSLIENPSNNDISTFLLQFKPYLDYLMFFDDDDVISKLRELRFANNVLKWIIRIEDIEHEIQLLIETDGFIFSPELYLFASIEYIGLKLKIELLEGFGLVVNYNNTETNTLFLDLSNRIRRRYYNRKNNPEFINSEYETLMNEQLNISEKKSIELGYKKNVIVNNVLKMAKGNTKIFTDLLEFRLDGLSKNEAYCMLFPLLKLIMKDVTLLDEDEFHNNGKNKSYDDNYRFYKYRKVQKLLLKK